MRPKLQKQSELKLEAQEEQSCQLRLVEIGGDAGYKIS
jgi:hypothetical protein